MKHTTKTHHAKQKHAKAKAKAKAVHAKTRRHRLHRPPGSTAAPGTGPTANPNDPASTVLTQPMVDRLFWRAGFGPAAGDRTTWTGRTVGDLVDWFLTTPASSSGAPGTDQGQPFDPTGNDIDLVLSWIDQMVRAANPFVERLTFFWHRHWANSRDQVSPPQLMITQINLFRKYADFSANPSATFQQMAQDVTIDPSMLRYLTGESNVKGAPNENYARELMELFTLGVLNAQGQPNYTQDDVEQLAKALSGWQINDTDPNNASSYFDQSQWYDGPKIIFGQYGNFTTAQAVNLVLEQPAHPAFIVTALWNEFIATPIDATSLASLTSIYTSGGFALKPLLQGILTNPAIFDSIDEPNLVKPPVVFVVGVMRALGTGVTDATAYDYLDPMGQVPYFPPTVAGWEGGLSWLNTNTALARFNFTAALVSASNPADSSGESASDAYTRAYAAVGSPWLASGTQTALQSIAGSLPSGTSAQRIARQVALRSLILSGPDGQVI